MSNILVLWRKLDRRARSEKAFREQGKEKEASGHEEKGRGVEGLLGAWERRLVTRN